MPKVSEDYREKKKQEILDAALTACKNKTLLSITLQDIIDESGQSQGNIYRYFSDIDEIIARLLVDFRGNAALLPELRTIFCQTSDSKQSPSEEFKHTLDRVIHLLGDFMENGMETYCKLDFEFNSLSMNYPLRAKKIITMVNQSSESNLGYLMKQTMQHYQKAASAGIIRLKIPAECLFSFINSAYSGIQMTSLQSYYGNQMLPWETFRPTVQLNTLAMSIMGLIEFNDEGAYSNE